jgi:hypothetical protein
MSISVAMSRPLRVVGRSTGKHALPRGAAPAPRAAATRQDKPHRPKHAAAARQGDTA